MNHFKANIEIIGINPFVFVPEKILKNIFKDSGKDKGHIPIQGMINGDPYKQTLVKYSGAWRLYINTAMLKNSPDRIGEKVALTIEFDSAPRIFAPHPKLIEAFSKNKKAKKIFDNLSPSRQKEIVRYISMLKAEETVIKNIARAIDHLNGKGRFVGRDAE